MTKGQWELRTLVGCHRCRSNNERLEHAPKDKGERCSPRGLGRAPIHPLGLWQGEKAGAAGASTDLVGWTPYPQVLRIILSSLLDRENKTANYRAIVYRVTKSRSRCVYWW